MSKAEKVLLKINDGWSDNWDMIVDTFGEEIAKELDEACLEIWHKYNVPRKEPKNL